jgi:hypothetical protein
MAYQKANNLPMARKEFNRALQINPQLSQAEEIKKLIGASQTPDK